MNAALVLKQTLLHGLPADCVCLSHSGRQHAKQQLHNAMIASFSEHYTQGHLCPPQEERRAYR